MSHASCEHSSLFLGQAVALPFSCTVDFSIVEGQCFGVVGQSGTGKTTLLKCLAGLGDCSKGRILYRGRLPSELSLEQWQVFRRSVGMTFQRGGLFDAWTVLENLEFALRQSGISPSQWPDRCRSALQDVGLAGQEHLRTYELSGGMQKRLGIARALLLQPQVILYDEPTAGLDPVTARTIWDLILSTQKELGMTVVVVSSDVRKVLKLCQQTLVLTQSGKWQVGATADLRQSPHAEVAEFVAGRKL